jgi:cobalt-zinc-cadmium efflux system membrane fusion protein
LREAQAGLDRQDRMMDQGVGIARDRLAAEIHLEEAQAEVERARATAAFVGEGQGATVTLRSPIAGVVLTIKATRGATVAPGGDTLIEVGDPAQLWIVADVPERELSQIVEGSRARFELTTNADPLDARVTSIGSVVSTGLRTAPVRMALESPPAGLRPGTYGWVSLEGGDGTMTLPVEAVLIKDGKDSVVYVAKDEQTFERRVVTVGRPLDGRVPVVSGLQAGERVVVRGALLLDGSGEQLL